MADAAPDPLLEELRAIRAALERQADALERLASTPSGRLPTRPAKQRTRTRVPALEAAEPVDEVTAVRARRALERAGIQVGSSQGG